MQESVDTDHGVRVVVSPSQASYFAGEPFVVTITISNLHTPQANLPPRAVSHSAYAHKRGAHSVSYVPMARPPTSPGVRTALPVPSRRQSDETNIPVRKRVIGTGQPFESAQLLPQAEVTEKRPMSGSNSSPVLPETPPVPSPLPNGSLLNLRSDIVQSSTSVESVLDGTRQPVKLAPAPRKPPLPGLGNGHLPNGRSVRKPLPSSFPIPNSELILYSYAQLVGTLSIVTLPNIAPTVEQVQTLQAVRNALTKRKAAGGGSMDIASHTPQSLPYGQRISSSRRVSHARSTSLTVGLFSLLSPSSLLPPSPNLPPPHHGRSQSLFSSFFGPSSSPTSPIGLGIGLNNPPDLDIVDPETPLPIIEVQPKMLAVDLTLSPGESRCYTYQLDLPRNLPPTYRGRCLRFSYEFILGVCRALPRSTSGPNNSSRVLKVPIRVYNHVVVDRPPTPYDLLWPVYWHEQSALVSLTETSGGIRHNMVTSSAANGDTSISDALRLYAKGLLGSASSNGNISIDRDADGRTLVWSDRNQEGSSSFGLEEAEGEPSCREAVEILTQNPKKLSYDVNKDGVKVAVLTFTKSAYRLGETVMGVIEVNRRAGRSRVLKLSALLEAHESLPDNISPPEPSSSRNLRRVHAEHHSSFITDTLRTTFSLDIPPDASPAFQIDVSSMSPFAPKGNPGGLEWKVRLCLFVAVASPNAREGADGVKLKHLVRIGQPGAWGTSWKSAKSIAPSERPSSLPDPQDTASATQSWTSFLTSTFLGSAEPSLHYHDGDEEIDGLDVDDLEADMGSDEDWKELAVEMVECVVPIKVWPGNTAFKAADVVLEV